MEKSVKVVKVVNRPNHTYYYQVEGVGEFPWDMLRYDSAFPYSESDSAQLQRHKKSLRIVNIQSNNPPTVERWKSFGWRVV